MAPPTAGDGRGSELTGQYVRGLLAANKTLSWLSLHYGLFHQLPRQYLSTAERGQKAVATAFEAWVAAAEWDYRARGEMDVFDDWLGAIYNFDVWPEAVRIIYHLQQAEVPGECFYSAALRCDSMEPRVSADS